MVFTCIRVFDPHYDLKKNRLVFPLFFWSGRWILVDPESQLLEVKEGKLEARLADAEAGVLSLEYPAQSQEPRRPRERSPNPPAVHPRASVLTPLVIWFRV